MLFLNVYYYFFFLRESAHVHTSREVAERGERSPSGLHANDSREPNMGLELANQEIVT